MKLTIYYNHLKRQGFELLEDIGSGLSGKTRKARQPSLERFVAVKFFDSVFNKNNHELRKKFKREAFILAEVQHPSIPYVLTHGEVVEGNNVVPYTVMEYIDGSNLDEYLHKNGSIEQSQVIGIASQILEALVLVHSKGIIYQCSCGFPIANTPFCGGCGGELFRIPECEKCGSYLQKADIGKNTSDGCSKCKSVQPLSQQSVWGQQSQKVPTQINIDDDIPF
ncbi:protein kinase domain-containing protein [Photobacterium swingsii]|uniref:protein kinase domain-containing protein n=1 Tax=Photobacterium swingsii TaxID=680026 RepID=UPI0040697BA1